MIEIVDKKASKRYTQCYMRKKRVEIMKKDFCKDRLQVHIYDTREEMGSAAALDIERAIVSVLAEKAGCNMIFAAAPSQNEVLASLQASDKVDWSRVHAFHMDEYIGLPADAPQGFANFLRNALFNRVSFGSVNCMDSTAEPEQEALRYAKLLADNPADIVVMGVGENGHIAFNDPHVALFEDPVWVKSVRLDNTCRMQQVHDGCFARIEDVPKMALTLTIPALFFARQAFCIVPAKTKACAIQTMLEGPISETCPASILRRHSAAVLYLDKDSASAL